MVRYLFYTNGDLTYQSRLVLSRRCTVLDIHRKDTLLEVRTGDTLWCMYVSGRHCSRYVLAIQSILKMYVRDNMCESGPRYLPSLLPLLLVWANTFSEMLSWNLEWTERPICSRVHRIVYSCHLLVFVEQFFFYFSTSVNLDDLPNHVVSCVRITSTLNFTSNCELFSLCLWTAVDHFLAWPPQTKPRVSQILWSLSGKARRLEHENDQHLQTPRFLSISQSVKELSAVDVSRNTSLRFSAHLRNNWRWIKVCISAHYEQP